MGILNLYSRLYIYIYIYIDGGGGGMVGFEP